MEREHIFQIAAATLAAWLAGFAKLLRRSEGERRRINWADVLIETPSAIVAGLMSLGLSITVGNGHPAIIAAAGAAAGHLGAPVITQMAMMFWRRFLSVDPKDKKNDAGPP
jgi:hypothetical protein